MTEREFNPGEPIAYFITWTCYGTWLPGDERGSWRKGGEWQPANELFREMAAEEMKETPFILSLDDRDIVEQTVAKHWRHSGLDTSCGSSPNESCPRRCYGSRIQTGDRS